MPKDVNIKLVFNHLPAVAPAAKARLAQVVAQTAKGIREDVHKEMQSPKHGRHYVIGGKPHVASAPGEAPAVFSSDLIDSIKEEMVGPLTYIVPAEGIQAWWEFGLRGYPARPYFRPAVDKTRPKFEKDCGEAVK